MSVTVLVKVVVRVDVLVGDAVLLPVFVGEGDGEAVSVPVGDTVLVPVLVEEGEGETVSVPVGVFVFVEVGVLFG